MSGRRVLRVRVDPGWASGPVWAVALLAAEFGLRPDGERVVWSDGDWCEMRLVGPSGVGVGGVELVVEFRWACGECPPDEWSWPRWVTVLDWGGVAA